MTTRLSILLLLILTACNSSVNDKTSVNNQSPIKSDIQRRDTLRINNYQYVQILKDDKFYCLFSIQGDTIVKPANYYHEASFLDIDEDGYKDIRVFVVGNTPNECDNYLFDKELRTFKLIEHCDLDIQKIKSTPFYYSYNRAGCGDLNWESYLSKIDNYKLVNYGYLYGQGCDFETKATPQVIEIYKVSDSNNGEKKLVERLSYLKHISKQDDKWVFIETYWKNNFKKFDR